MFDVMVVGVGAMGSAALWELSRRGVKAAGVEQFDVPHPWGSSHGQSRLIRMAYYEHAHYVPLLKRAYERWRMVEREEGVRVLEITGGLYMGRGGGSGSALVEGSIASARAHGLAHERLSGAEIQRRWGVFRGLAAAGMEGVYEADAGFLRPEAAVAAFATGAMKRGAEIRARERVVGWKRAGGGYRVRTDRGEYAAGKIVVTAGAWSAGLLEGLRGKLAVTRQVMGWVWPKEPERFAIGAFPSWCMEVEEGGLVYGPPLAGLGGGRDGNWEGGPVGLKVAHHVAGERCAAETVDRTERPGDWTVIRRVLREHLPAADGPAMGMKVCLYTNSPDHHFVVDQAADGVVFAAGFSGHGFKFASVMGEALADLAIGGKTALPVEFLRAGRQGMAPGVDSGP
ncbi:MAG TPA: N-methyl-L-tryptophan oxidase [Phycisphaerae bacterium]|nr:N-methyl-L-tryptophan oxidase [Phycisphaerae bacterium]